jgi:hypothetical protein
VKKIYVILEGGCIQNVYSDEKEVEVIIIDRDTTTDEEQEEEEKLTEQLEKDLKHKAVCYNW